MRFRHLTRSGSYLRVADPAWRSPLDPRFASRRGGRWNPPGSFPVVYLCASPEVAHAVAVAKFALLPYGLLDLRPERRPILIQTDVPERRMVDVVTDAGCRAATLPTTYPLDGRGRRIGWPRTQTIGSAAFEQGEAGIACRSASLPRRDRTEELAWFVRNRRDRLRTLRRLEFDDWFVPTA